MSFSASLPQGPLCGAPCGEICLSPIRKYLIFDEMFITFKLGIILLLPDCYLLIYYYTFSGYFHSNKYD